MGRPRQDAGAAPPSVSTQARHFSAAALQPPDGRGGDGEEEEAEDEEEEEEGEEDDDDDDDEEEAESQRDAAAAAGLYAAEGAAGAAGTRVDAGDCGGEGASAPPRCDDATFASLGLSKRKRGDVDSDSRRLVADYFTGLDFSPDDLRRMARIQPCVFGMPSKRSQARVKLLTTSFGLTEVRLKEVVVKQPRILGYRLEETLAPCLAFLKEIGVAEADLPKVRRGVDFAEVLPPSNGAPSLPRPHLYVAPPVGPLPSPGIGARPHHPGVFGGGAGLPRQVSARPGPFGAPGGPHRDKTTPGGGRA